MKTILIEFTDEEIAYLEIQSSHKIIVVKCGLDDYERLGLQTMIFNFSHN